MKYKRYTYHWMPWSSAMQALGCTLCVRSCKIQLQAFSDIKLAEQNHILSRPNLSIPATGIIVKPREVGRACWELQASPLGQLANVNLIGSMSVFRPHPLRATLISSISSIAVSTQSILPVKRYYGINFSTQISSQSPRCSNSIHDP